MLVIQTKEEIYDTLSDLITDFEHPENVKNYDKIDWANTFYDMLVIIQNRWEDTITAQEKITMKNTLTYQELKSLFRQREECLAKVPTKPEDHLVGCIVFTEDSFTVPYSFEERTYVVSSNNKAFQPNMGGYSIYASSLDGSDRGVRLEGYMAEEGNGERGWTVDYCYLMNMEV